MELRKMWLNINGADRVFVCDPAEDSLADVIRRIGLTGTKVGCGVGVCGACSVILNGKVVRSCALKIRNIPEYSKVTTIEGIGTPNNLHPLQQAWLTYGGVQCGFCTPGFIVSAKALLDENLNPTREEVRQWFQKHQNMCRCTGYIPLVDAVMAAAKVMRGEASMEEITYHEPKDGEYYGTGVPRPTGIAKVCGLCEYGDDVSLKMPRATYHLAVVQPRQYHHAKILGIDFSEAEKMPGVICVLTAKDVKGSNLIVAFNTHKRSTVVKPSHPIICDDKIFRYGDVVALVVADTKRHARAAAKKVHVELEQLPEYLNYLDAVMPGAMRVHDDTPNLFVQQPIFKGDHERVPEIIDNAPYSVSASFSSTREPHLSLEGDIVQAYQGDDGLLTIQCKAQNIYGAIKMISQGLGVETEKIRIIQNNTGGSFGWSMSPASFALAAVATMATGMPVSLSMSYEEHQHFSGKRCPAYSNARLACDEKGKLMALECEVGMDHGAYSDNGEGLITRVIRYMGWPYYIPHARGLARMANTNHAFGVAYRGYGAPQVQTANEAIVDMLAEKMGMDPFEFRYINVARPGDTAITGFPYRQYPMEHLMDLMRPLYKEALAKAKAEDTPELRRGVGIVCAGYNCTGGKMDSAKIALELNSDGTISHYNTWQDLGQGGDIGSLMFALEALKPLKLRPEQVIIKQNDSKIAPNSGSSSGSRQHMMCGLATIDAANKLLDAMRKPDGSFRSYDEMTAEGIPTKYMGVQENTVFSDLCEYDPNTGVGDPIPTYMYACFMAEVEVETSSGKVRVVGYTSVADVGQIGNRISVEGQAYGGISHCIGFALSENYDDVKKHKNVLTSGAPCIKDIPDNIRLIFVDSYRKEGPFGSSGCSELFQCSGHVAVINAINNACGVRVYNLPATPDKVKAGLDIIAAGGTIEPPSTYFLGSDLDDELENILANPV